MGIALVTPLSQYVLSSEHDLRVSAALIQHAGSLEVLIPAVVHDLDLVVDRADYLYARCLRNAFWAALEYGPHKVYAGIPSDFVHRKLLFNGSIVVCNH
jgi:hypothetical protein